MALVLAIPVERPMIWSGRSRSPRTAGTPGAPGNAGVPPAPRAPGPPPEPRATGLPPEPRTPLDQAWREDGELVERARVDPEAFGVLYDRYCTDIYRYVLRRVGDPQAAEDVTAEVFFKALRAIDGYRLSAGPFSGWLYRIAGNAVIDFLRARRATVSLDYAADTPDHAAPVEEQAIGRLEAARVWAAIDSLSDAQRTAVTLRLGEDLPLAAIAARMQRSEGAVKLLLHRGLAAVRAHLENAGIDRATGRDREAGR